MKRRWLWVYCSGNSSHLYVSWINWPLSLYFAFLYPILSLCQPYHYIHPRARENLWISILFGAFPSHWGLHNCFSVVSVTTVLKNRVQLAGMLLFRPLLIDFAPLDMALPANGVCATMNDPDALQLPGNTDAHFSCCGTPRGHDMIFIHGLWEGLWIPADKKSCKVTNECKMRAGKVEEREMKYIHKINDALSSVMWSEQNLN